MLDRKTTFGERLSLPDIAEKTGVSVTPIREALAQLEQAGVVSKVANRGFFVPHLSVTEAQDIYPIIISLETMAIRQSKFSPAQIQRLEQIQSKFEKARSKERAVKYDLQFHETLLENFNNKIANRILADLKVRVFFYELDYMSNSESKKGSYDCHRQIISFLKKGKPEKAAILLQKNWEASLDFLIQYYN